MHGKIELDTSMAEQFVRQHELEYIEPRVKLAHELLQANAGPGSDFAGWVHWPQQYDREELARIKELSSQIRDTADAFVVLGIGGSYLGARSTLELLSHTFHNKLSREERNNAPEIYFAGNNISPVYLSHLLDIIKDKDIVINVISKSGTTLETALAFRIFRQLMEKRYGKKEAGRRIIATTDREKGVLKALSLRDGYETLTVPADVGGRYSVLTAVGLLPIAVGGVDIDELMAGAAAGYHFYSKNTFPGNPCYLYAAFRNIFYLKGKLIELMAAYEPSFYYFIEWWKQLFGESEGKDNKGIFPAGLNFTTDLHSMGQYVQDGYRNIFTTTLWAASPAVDLDIPVIGDDEGSDGLGYLAGKTFHYVNEKACEGTMLAHAGGMVPGLKVVLPEISPFYHGMMVYFFERACAISGYLMGVNPFDQPGVEEYKKNVFKLLGKKS